MLGLNAGETSCTADHPPLTADDDGYALLSTPALMIYLYLKGSESEIEIQRWNSVSLHCLLLSLHDCRPCSVSFLGADGASAVREQDSGSVYRLL